MLTLWIRAAALAIIFSAASIAIYFKQKRRRAATPQRSRHEPQWLSAVITTVAILLGIATILATLNPYSLSVASRTIQAIPVVSGSLLGILGCWLMYASLKHLDTNFSGTSGTYPNHHLVTTGPYRYIRHPYYSATALIIVSLSLLLTSGLILSLGVLLLLSLALRSQAEEKELEQRFPEDFLTWKAATGRFGPPLRLPRHNHS